MNSSAHFEELCNLEFPGCQPYSLTAAQWGPVQPSSAQFSLSKPSAPLRLVSGPQGCSFCPVSYFGCSQSLVPWLADGLLVEASHGCPSVLHMHPWCLFVGPSFLFLIRKNTGCQIGLGPTLM